MNIPVPQRGERYQKMYDAAIEYFLLLDETAGDISDERKAAVKADLDRLSSPFSDNVAYHAFLEMKRLVSGIDGAPELISKADDA